MSLIDGDETLKPDSMTDTNSHSFYESLPVSSANASLAGRQDEMVQSDDERYVNSPSDNTSFHTAGSLDSSVTEVDIDSHSSQDYQDTEPQRVFDLPPGYESHLKLDVVDSYEATLEEKHIPEDSISERLLRAQTESSEPVKMRKPSIDIPSESTPLIAQNTSLSGNRRYSKDNADCGCCTVL